MTVKKFRGQTEKFTDFTNLILEKSFQRFNQLKFEIFRQSADIVVTFDNALGVAVKRNTLNDIRIDRSLTEEGSLGLFRSFSTLL